MILGRCIDSGSEDIALEVVADWIRVDNIYCPTGLIEGHQL